MPSKSRLKTITRDPNWLGPAMAPGEILLEEFLKPLANLARWRQRAGLKFLSTG